MSSAILVLSELGAAAAVASGLYAAPGLMVSVSIRHELLRNHKHLMVAASAVTGVLTVWALATRPMPTRGRYVFLAGLIAVMCLIAAGGGIGGGGGFWFNTGGSARA